MNEISSFLIDFSMNLFFAFLGVVLAIWYENLGSAQLFFTPESTTDEGKSNGWRTRFLHVGIKNVPKKIPFVIRQTAFSVH